MEPHGSSSRIHLSSLESTQAKVIVLGDENTGKTELIRNLDSPTSSTTESSKNDGFFTLVEIPSEELEISSASVLLKIWEHSRGVSKQEEDLAFRGALFCIVTLDIRDPETANSALNRWVSLKESLAPESFLFVVGTHLDRASHRRVDLKEICKACAKKDAIYMEVSNTTLVNMPLLKKLIKQRLNYMLYRKDVIAQRPFVPPSTVSHHDDSVAAAAPEHGHAHAHAAEENKNAAEDSHTRRFSYSLRPHGAAHDGGAGGGHSSSASHAHVVHHARNLSVPALEPNILCDSVGSILASHLGTEFWPGLEEEGEELERIGWKIGSFIEQLSHSGVTEATLTTASTALLDDAFSTVHNFRQAAPAQPVATPRSPGRHAGSPGKGNAAHPAAGSQGDEYVDSAYSLADLHTAFEVMGLALPASLLDSAAQEGAPQAADTGSSRPKANTNATAYLRKMTVKLPDGTSADMILDLDGNIEQQIELFLLSNSLAEDDEARQKLIAIGRKVQNKYCAKEGRPSPQPIQYHNAHGRRETSSSPSDSSASGLGKKQGGLLHHIQGSVPFSGGRNSPLSVPGDGNSVNGMGAGASVDGSRVGGAGGPKKAKLRIALSGGATAEVIYRSGDNLQVLTEGLMMKHQLSREQAQKVYEQLARATAAL